MVCKVAGMPWPYAVRLRSDRLVLDPLSIEHADVMVNVLAPRELYRFTGGEPPSAEDLRRATPARSEANPKTALQDG